MPLEVSFWTYLTAQIVDLRLYPERLPQQPALPAATYQRVSTTPVYTHDGDANADQVRMQVSTFALTRADADALLARIRAVLSGFRGAMAGTTIGGIFLLNQTTDYEPDLGYYVSRQDYSIRVTR